jgi:hypothetical protein
MYCDSKTQIITGNTYINRVRQLGFKKCFLMMIYRNTWIRKRISGRGSNLRSLLIQFISRTSSHTRSDLFIFPFFLFCYESQKLGHKTGTAFLSCCDKKQNIIFFGTSSIFLSTKTHFSYL